MNSIKQTLDNNFAQLTHEASPWALETKEFNGISYKYYPKAPKNLIELLDQGRQYADNEFLIYQDERISYAEFFHQADAIAWQLQNTYQIKPGDRVAIAMRNYPEWMMAFVAIAQTGAVIVPLNSWGQKAEIEYGLKDAGCKLAFFDQQRFDYVADDLATLNIEAIIVRPTTALAAKAQSFAELVQQADGEKATAIEIDSESLALIMYTAGTTGEPKGAMASHRNICQAIYNFEVTAICAAMSNGDAITKMLERGFPAKNLLGIPLFHVSGCHSVFLLSIRANRPIVIMHKWDKQKALELIEKERITTVYAVPTMIMDLFECEEWEQYDTRSLFAFGAGGAAQPPHLVEQIYSKLPDSFPGTGYGMTETSATGFSSTGAAYAYKPKSCGTATPLVEIRIVDDNEQELPSGKVGHIWLKSVGVVQGYWNKPEASQETFYQGWVKTGDIGYLDEEDFLYITDRSKDLIIRGGENISSIEIEQAALSHPDIAEAAAFGLPHAKLGEELAMAVVLKAARQLTVSELQHYLAQQLSAFKVPSQVFFLTELPRNATQKVLKAELKKRYK